MKNILLFVAAMLVSGVASAASISCSGDYFGYHFNVRTAVAGAHTSGKISIDVSNGSGFHQSGKFSPRSSDIRPKQYLRFAGRSSNGASTGAVAANFVSGNSYSGTLSAQSTQGNVNVPVACVLKSGRSLEFGYDDVSSEMELLIESFFD